MLAPSWVCRVHLAQAGTEWSVFKIQSGVVTTTGAQALRPSHALSQGFFARRPEQLRTKIHSEKVLGNSCQAGLSGPRHWSPHRRRNRAI